MMKKIIFITLVLGSVCLPFLAQAATVHFVVSEIYPASGRGDSYILPLANPEAIKHARDLIEFGPSIGQALVVARIASGADGVNRNVLAPGEPLWSWHVTEFLGFADFTIEILDGDPSWVEEDVEGWLGNTGGVIGFWGYTVTQEVAVPIPGALVLTLSGMLGLALCNKKKR